MLLCDSSLLKYGQNLILEVHGMLGIDYVHICSLHIITTVFDYVDIKPICCGLKFPITLTDINRLSSSPFLGDGLESFNI